MLKLFKYIQCFKIYLASYWRSWKGCHFFGPASSCPDLSIEQTSAAQGPEDAVALNVTEKNAKSTSPKCLYTAFIITLLLLAKNILSDTVLSLHTGWFLGFL